MNILTFDIEDWFHINFDKSFNDERNWISYDSRIEKNVDLILDELEERNIFATFFCLGWVARKHPNIIKKFQSRGHDIGTHSNLHNLISLMTPEEFDKDLKESLDCIENVIGEKVKMFRAPAFSIGRENLWAFEVLNENGIEIDASIFPAQHDFGGFQEVHVQEPFRLKYKQFELKEFPMSTIPVLNRNIVVTGGGFFRFFPYWLIKKSIRKYNYTMTYFHPRDIDMNQPVLEGLSLIRRFKSYYGLKDSLNKFQKLLNDFEFISISEAVKNINWSKSQIVKIP